MLEAILSVWLVAIGVVTASVAARHLGIWGTVFVSPLTGAAAYSLVGLVLTGFSIFDTVLTLSVASCAAVGAVAVSRLVERRWPPLRTVLTAMGIAAAGAVVVSFVLQAAHLTRLTPDSMEYLTMAGSLERFGVLASFAPELLLKRQFTTGALQAIGVVTGLGYSPTPVFLVTASGLATTTWLGNRILGHFHVPARWRWAIAGSATLLLITTNRVAYNLFYINGHGTFAGFLLIAVGFAWYGVTTERWSMLALSALGFAALVPLRADGAAVAVIFLIPIVTAASVPIRGRWMLTVPLIVTTVVWYGMVLFPYLPGDEYRPTGTAGAYLLVALGLIPLMLTTQLPATRSVVKWIPWAVFGTLGAFVVWSAHDDFPSLIKTLGATGMNIGAYGLWVAFWWVAPLLVAVAVTVVVVPNQRFFIPGLLTFPVALVAFAYLRDGPYRAGTGDSANRMLMHIVFVLVLYLIAAAGVAYREAFGEDGSTPSPSSKTTAAGSTA